MSVGATATALKSVDWSAFSPPYRGWEHSIARVEAEAERRIEAAVSEARAGALAEADSAWFAFLREHMQVSAFVAKDAERALRSAATLCPWPEVSRCLELQAQTQARRAQAIVLYAIDLEGMTGAMPVDLARTHWREDPMWQPARELIATISTVRDWGEVFVAMNLCFEPMISQMLLEEFGVGAARAHGDQVTPAVAEAGIGEWEWTRDWTLALVWFLVADPVHGGENRTQIDQWLTRWTPSVMSAASGVAELARATPQRLDPDAAIARLAAQQQHLAREAGVAGPHSDPPIVMAEHQRPGTSAPVTSPPR